MDDAERWSREGNVFVTLSSDTDYTDFVLTPEQVRVMFEALAEHERGTF